MARFLPLTYGRLLLHMYVIIIILIVGLSDRTNTLDNENYIRYFSDLDQINFFFERLGDYDLASASIRFFSEEFLWTAYSWLISNFSNPNLFIPVTICTINILIIYSIWRSGGGLYGCLLWALLPVCMATIGYFQIRQGFAVMCFLTGATLGLSPLIMALISSMIHTTFLIPAAILLFGSIPWIKNRAMLRQLFLSAFFISFCFVAGEIFGEFGGRRSSIYESADGASSPKFLIGLLAILLPSILIIWRGEQYSGKTATIVSQLHLGVTLWLISAFFLFPLGTSRIGYYAQIFSIIPAGIIARKRDFTSCLFSAIYLIMAAVLIYNGARDGAYSQLFNPN